MAISAMLSGCDTPTTYYAPMAIRSAGTSLEVAICADTTVSSAYASARPEGEPWARFWEASASGVAIAAGETAVIEEETFGLAASLNLETNRSPGTEIDIVFVPKIGDATISGSFQVPESGLSDETWLQVDGTMTMSACDDA